MLICQDSLSLIKFYNSKKRFLFKWFGSKSIKKIGLILCNKHHEGFRNKESFKMVWVFEHEKGIGHTRHDHFKGWTKIYLGKSEIL